MRVFRNLAHLMMATAATLTLATDAKATPLFNATGLANAGQTIEFDEIALAAGTQVTNQFAAFGVTFDPYVYYDTLYPASFPGIVGHHVGNFLLVNNTSTNLADPFAIRFTSPVSGAAIGLATNLGLTSLSAYYQGALVQAFQYGSSATNPTAAFVGFENILFDTLVVNPGSTGIAVVDNIQFTAVPEPTSLLLLGSGVAGLIARARRRRTA